MNTIPHIYWHSKYEGTDEQGNLWRREDGTAYMVDDEDIAFSYGESDDAKTEAWMDYLRG